MLPHTHYTNTPFAPHTVHLTDDNSAEMSAQSDSTSFPTSSPNQRLFEPRPRDVEYFQVLSSVDDTGRGLEGLRVPKKRHATTGSQMRSIEYYPAEDEGMRSFTSGARTDMELSQRTAQACERCKLRKMKCDSNPNGCAHCRDATEVCFQVDRVTKARVARGEIERTKRQNEELLRENNALKIQQQHFLHEIQKLTLELRNLRGDSHTGDGAQPKRDETAFSSHSGVSQRQPFPPYSFDLQPPVMQSPPSFAAISENQRQHEALERQGFYQDSPPPPLLPLTPHLYNSPVEPMLNPPPSFSDTNVVSSHSSLIISSAAASPQSVMSSEMTRIQGLETGFSPSPEHFIFPPQNDDQQSWGNSQ